MAKWNAEIDYSGTLWSGKQMTAEIREASKEVEGYALEVLQKNSPVRTGRLRNSWLVKTGDRTIRIRNTAYYAGFPNYGTRRIKAQLFLEKSTEQILAKYKEILADKVEQKLGRSNSKPNRELAAQVAKLRKIVSPRQQLPIKLT